MKTREMKFRVRTDVHDLAHKTKKVREFLEDGDRVKLVVTFRGREMAHPDLGQSILERVQIDLSGLFTISSPTKLEGRAMSITLNPKC